MPTVTLPAQVNGQPLHDLGDSRRWGNDYSVEPISEDGRTARFVIWRSARLDVGHYLAVPNPANALGYACYEITKADRAMDPGDQHFITARFVPASVWRKA